MAPGLFAPSRTRPPTTSFPVVVVLLLHYILLGLLSQSTTAALQQVMLDTGALEVGEELYNEERNYMLLMEGDCNLALFDGSKSIWQSHTGGHGGNDCRTEFRRIGGVPNLVIATASSNTILWKQGNYLARTEYVLVMQPDRNVVIYATAVWATDTSLQNVSHVADDQILIASGTLEAGQSLVDRQHNYKFIMQEDCNLVLYDGSKAIWESKTKGAGTGCRASLNGNGNLVIHDKDGSEVWKSRNKSPPFDDCYALLLKPDRNLVVYTHPAWSTGTYVSPAGCTTRINMVTNKLQAV